MVLSLPKFTCVFISLLLFAVSNAQQQKDSTADFTVSLFNEQSQSIPSATVAILQDGKLIKLVIADTNGVAVIENIFAGAYTFSITHNSYETLNTSAYLFPETNSITIKLKPTATLLNEVSVSAKKPFIQNVQGKTILNVDASVLNIGTTVLEVLEKSPGVMVDKNGGISLKGKSGVLVLIDDKATYLSGAELNNLLSSMNSSQVEQIELIPNPPAKYDASGNAGVINIKTKKNKVKGFNGSVILTAGQGVYSKKNSSLVLNYRTGKFNIFLTYSTAYNKYFTNIYALRKYYNNSNLLTAVLDQPTRFKSDYFTNTIKTGIDYFISTKTTLGFVLGGNIIHRKAGSNATATWFDESGLQDSTVLTTSTSNNYFKNASINVNLRHALTPKQDIAVDIDGLNYKITNSQNFNNSLQGPSGYTEISRGSLPALLKIISVKFDHTLHFGKANVLLSGFKSSHINTDNTAAYQNFDGAVWQEDHNKSNHFLYKENINALYTSFDTEHKRFNMQAGLRYELTNYNAHQLGNLQQKDSAFHKMYSGLFPSGFLTYQADSSNSFTITVGRRLDRPAFQSLNPFTFIINKYTYETGNPFIVPQYSWNFELTHQYREFLTTAISYGVIKNYFSQLFLTDTVTGLLFYSQGNVGRTYNIGFSTTLVLSPVKWWSLTMQALYNYKELKGFNGTTDFRSDINQLNINLRNQFNFLKIYTGELAGFYTTRARNDLQEVLYPTGQVALGISRPVIKKKGTLKISVRDIFYAKSMEGFTQFNKATEYFYIRRDSRVISLGFTYRFGKAYKVNKRAAGGADDEIERVGTGR
ncbi:MAG: outer membrane beta-barrel protein [Bacteroidota bacterium]